MKEFLRGIRDIYGESGIFPFLLSALFMSVVIFTIVSLCTLGSEDCFHPFQRGDFCTYCGDQLREHCPSCGSLVFGSSFCGSCGQALK